MIAHVRSTLGIALCAACVFLVGVPQPTAAGPEPDPVPTKWQLDLRVGALRLATFEIDGVTRRFFYLTYQVTNNSDQDLLFAPSFTMTTDSGLLARSGRNVPLEVTKSLLAEQRKPLMKDQIAILGQIQRGPEHMREGIVIWPVVDFDADELTVYCTGFSGETKTVTRPDNGEPVVLRKTYMLRYRAPGSLAAAGSEAMRLATRPRWILR